ncbi:hypothetical protein M23134_02730 [Microscilla marina ATCC 23134]|uniref:Uncharacterized protein n=1 Tax=Microscilla marina ATCC 23134 TaxID=313606 RepID=A1ZZ42_MICM2|nr:hypothetical protein M23134_02730 [Microscilla marina ATCC 23134]
MPIQENILFSDDSKKTVHNQSYETFFEKNEGNRYTLMAQIIYERSLITQQKQ